jgi:hypothetical protein
MLAKLPHYTSRLIREIIEPLYTITSAHHGQSSTKQDRYNQIHPTKSVPEPETAVTTPKGDSRLPAEHPHILCPSPSYHHNSPPSCLPSFICSWPLSVPPSTQFDPYRRTLNSIWVSTWMDGHLGTLYVDGPFWKVGYSVALKKAVSCYIFLSAAPIGPDQLQSPTIYL